MSSRVRALLGDGEKRHKVFKLFKEKKGKCAAPLITPDWTNTILQDY